MKLNEIKYTCKVLPLGIAVSVAIALGVGMSIVFFTTYISIHPIIATILMVLSMFLCIYFLSSDATFYLSELELNRILLANNFIFKNNKAQAFTWNDIKSYKTGKDLGRYRGEYQFLNINFKNGVQWKITDSYGEQLEAYNNFLNYFKTQVQLHNENTSSRAIAETPKQKVNTILTEIKKEKTFYDSIFGKLFTIGIGIFIVALITVGRSYLTSAAKLKLFVVLIPGFLYILYRTFLEKKE